MSSTQTRPKRLIVKLRDLVGKTFEYKEKFSGSSKYGEYIAFTNDQEMLFVSAGHKAYEAAQSAPPAGTLTVSSHVSKNGRTYFTLTAV